MPAKSCQWVAKGIAALVVAGFLNTSYASGELQLTPVALSGQIAPGTTDAFTWLSAGLLHDGQIVLRGDLDAPSGSNSGLWVGSPQDLTLRFRTGTPAPGIAGATFSSAFPTVNAAGQLLVNATVPDTGIAGVTSANNRGLWSDANGELQLMARTGTAGPELGANAVYWAWAASFSAGSFNDQGQAVVRAGLAAPANPYNWSGEALLVGRPGDLAVVARSGQVAPGDTRPFKNIPFGAMAPSAINSAGELAFKAELEDPSGPFPQRGIWFRQANGQTAPVMITGQVAPGTGGRTYRSGGSGSGTVPAINDAGQIAFHMGLSGPSLYDAAVFFGTPDNVRPVAVSGDAAPGAAPQLAFQSFWAPKLTQSGLVTFAATLQGEGLNYLNNEGIWAYDGAEIRLLLLEGQSFPGLPAGLVVGRDSDIQGNLSGYMPNDNGWIFGSTPVAGEGITADNDRILYVLNAFTGQRLFIAREGDPFLVAPGDERIIAEVLGGGGPSGANTTQALSLNDRNELVFSLRFTDGSYGTYYTTVPEPSWLGLSLLLLPLLRRRRGPAAR